MRRRAVEYFDKVINAAFKRFGEPQNHRQARHLHAPFEVADEWAVRAAALREFSLCQVALDAKFAEALAEDRAFIRDRQNVLLSLTNEGSVRILWDAHNRGVHMLESTRDRIRRIFLNRGPNFALFTAAALLGITMRELKRDIDDGAIVAVSTGVGMRVPKEELIAAAMRVWEQGVIEAALGDDAARVLPAAIRLVLLRARVPRYQRDMLVALAKRHGTTVDDVLTRELEDVACAHAEELATVVPALSAMLAWPGQA